jgi:hypothetical protein
MKMVGRMELGELLRVPALAKVVLLWTVLCRSRESISVSVLATSVADQAGGG